MVDVSIVIATSNRSAQLRRCLDALFAHLPASAACEVIVVVDGSTDDTLAMLGRLTPPCPFHILSQPNRMKPTAVNRGVGIANGEALLLLDDDIIASPALIDEHLRAQRSSGGVIGVGQVTLKLPAAADRFTRYFATAWDERYRGLNLRARPPTCLDCSGGNLSVPRAAFLAVGGFAVGIPDSFDVELAYRLVQRGLPIRYLPEATAEREYQKGFVEILADAERQGRARVSLYRRHPPMLAHLDLGAFTEDRARAVLLRRILLALRVPPRLLRLASIRARGRDAQRWYRFLYGYSYWRGVRRAVRQAELWRRLTEGTVILMYHAIGRREPASRYIVPVRRFAAQMGWLHRAGYHVLSLEEFARHKNTHRFPTPRSVVLTFDDGYRDTYTEAYPILQHHAFPATVFLVSDAVGTANGWDRSGELWGRPLLGWDEARVMAAAGIGVGAHTRTHVALPTVRRPRAEEEILGSKAALEQALDTPVMTFAYPHGEFDATEEEIVARGGFLCACGVQPACNGAATPDTGLRRIEVYGTDSIVRFVLTLWLGQKGIALPHGDGGSRSWIRRARRNRRFPTPRNFRMLTRRRHGE